jgi:diguanylate cyclase (GGDEF)-like protein
MSTAAIFLAMAPVAVVLADRSLILVPLLAMPLAAIYKSAATSMEKDYQSLHDILTGLPNRSLFRDRVEQAMQSGQREGAGHGIMIIDLNRFKEINDTLGHHIGDLLLREIGPRLTPLLRASDTVARLGGDEFGILLRGVAGRMEAELMADKIVRALQRSFEVKGMNLDIDGSIGIALYPDEGDDVDVLIQRADVAMYRAKEQHKGWENYSAEHDQYTVNRLVLISDLRHAVESNDFVVHYQPKIELQNGNPSGVEALVRWNHPTRGTVLPDEFIPLAERTGMMRPLTLQVLEKALQQCHEWHQSGLNLTVAVNISARNLQDLDLPADIGRLLASCDVPADSLELEITESTIMADPARAMGILLALHNMGIRLAIDDFGTGYSSLAYLKRLPVDEIKIDKSFITQLTPSSDDAIIVRSTVDMAANLGLTVLAEGVESAATMQYLRSIGCQAGQGYFMSRPLPAGDVASWIEDWRARAQSLFPPIAIAKKSGHFERASSPGEQSGQPVSSATV